MAPKSMSQSLSTKDFTNVSQMFDTCQKVEELEATLSKLTSDYQHAIDEKVRCQQEADATAKTIALANRLVNGLASEKVSG